MRFSPDCSAFRWQFNQYRHTLSVFLSGACAADSGIVGVGGDGHGGGGGAVGKWRWREGGGGGGGGGGGSHGGPLLPSPSPPTSGLVRITRAYCLPDRFAESGQPAERLRRQHLSQQLLLPPLQTAGDGTAGSSRDMCVLPQLPLCSCRDSPDAHERIIARRPLLYSLLEPSTRGAPDGQPPQTAPKGESQGFRADGTAAMRADAGAGSRGFDPAPFCFTTESQ